MSGNGLASVLASLAAVLVALVAWRVAETLTDALGLEPVRPLVLVTVLFLALTALQAGWDRVHHALRSPNRHPKA